MLSLLLLIVLNPKLIVMSRSIILIIGRDLHPLAQTIYLPVELPAIPVKAFDLILLLFLSVDNLATRTPGIIPYNVAEIPASCRCALDLRVSFHRSMHSLPPCQQLLAPRSPKLGSNACLTGSSPAASGAHEIRAATLHLRCARSHRRGFPNRTRRIGKKRKAQ